MFFSPAVGVEIHNRDSTWTPGWWHEMAEVSSNDDSSDEKEADVHVFKAYNEAMTRIASLTEQLNMFPLGFQRNGKRQRQMKKPYVKITWKRHVALFAM